MVHHGRALHLLQVEVQLALLGLLLLLEEVLGSLLLLGEVLLRILSLSLGSRLSLGQIGTSCLPVWSTRRGLLRCRYYLQLLSLAGDNRRALTSALLLLGRHLLLK